jgi:hypothetical protein
MSATLLNRRRRRGLFLLVTLLTGIAAAFGAPALAEEATGRLQGLVLDPDGEPSEGFRLVFVDDAGKEHVSGPSDELGRYALDILPGSYRLVAAVAPDDERLDVPDLPPIPVDASGRRLDIRIAYPTKPTAVASAPSSAKSRTRWIQIGTAAAATVLLILLLDGDTDEKTASPFVPRG